MALVNQGPYKFWLERDLEGHREYHVLHKVVSSTPYKSGGTGDGPQSILNASGLPVIGDYWNYGNDADTWAICHPQKSVKPFERSRDEPNSVYSVESVFSTKPLTRCMTDSVGDPLDEPQGVRGNSVRTLIEAVKDRFGNPIMSSSHEMIRGPQVEFDSGRDQVIIEQNVADLELNLCTSLRNKVNDDTLWGLSARRIKLTDFTWEELWYGSCIYYYKRIFLFDIRNNADDLFDRSVLDEGTKVLNGVWDEATGHWVDVAIEGYSYSHPGEVNPDPDNPQHFIRYTDRKGQIANVILDGKGRPADTITQLGTGTYFGTGTDSTDEAGQHWVEYYDEADLTQLNIPTNLEFGTAAS